MTFTWDNSNQIIETSSTWMGLHADESEECCSKESAAAALCCTRTELLWGDRRGSHKPGHSPAFNRNIKQPGAQGKKIIQLLSQNPTGSLTTLVLWHIIFKLLLFLVHSQWLQATGISLSPQPLPLCLCSLPGSVLLHSPNSVTPPPVSCIPEPPAVHSPEETL